MNVPWVPVMLVGILATVYARAQPQLGVAVVNTPCHAAPIQTGGQPDTVSSEPDSAGFLSIFDGKSLKGWWENCHTSQSAADRNLGAIWFVDTALGALYSNQAPSGAGSILTTNKSFGNYEIEFDFWSWYGNDAGLFNRMVPTGPQAGSSFQTLLDYIDGGNIGGAYAEEYYGGSSPGNPLFSVFPYTLRAPEGTLTVAGWTAFTAARDPVSFGCPVSGCTSADWNTVWDTAGWNQIRVRFWGGRDSSDGQVKMQSWFRRLSGGPGGGAGNWVPVYDDSVAVTTPGNPIGLQVHGGIWWAREGRGTWYRNIRIRPLDAAGNPVIPPPPGVPAPVFPSQGSEGVNRNPRFSWSRVAGALRYRVQVAFDTTATMVRDTVLADSSVGLGQFPAHTRVHWRVRAENNSGVSAFSVWASFATGGDSVVFVQSPVPSWRGGGFRLQKGVLVGDVPEPHRLIVRDVRGRVLARFAGRSGEGLKYALPQGVAGVVHVELFTPSGRRALLFVP